MIADPTGRAKLKRFALLSIVAALVTIVLKSGAYLMTGSVGLLSDALESFVNLAGAIMALAMLSVAARPEDDDHPHGHGKAEYFSSGVEGTLILLAAVSIAWAAVERLLHPKPLQDIGVGLAIALMERRGFQAEVTAGRLGQLGAEQPLCPSLLPGLGRGVICRQTLLEHCKDA